MSKITFRADDTLVEQLDDLDASKSEVMREALREFLDRQPGTGSVSRQPETTTADPVTERIDELLEERLTENAARDVNVNISVDGPGEATVEGDAASVEGADEVGSDPEACNQCGHTVGEEHAYCPNCGEEHNPTPRCECGEEIGGDWAFCPGCGRRSPTSDVYDTA
ncbi:MAG: zinc ribbon domain-containing protein [Halolamina sp.]